MSALAELMDEIDDWCGTGRKHGPFPPRPHLQDELIAVVLQELAPRVSQAAVREELTKLGGMLADQAVAAR
ncbi:MAG TPA: hypothetical protein VKV73_07485 [Chloroflexota bacterium]|nr:hypothetical protein [Chloroflexota bacterium]